MAGKNFSGKQMSEAFINSAFLALSGGFQDAYTYNTRNEVFSNAQTGNVVLMSQHFMTGDWKAGVRYLLPLIAFVLGVFVADQIQMRYKYARRLHWRQGILLAEIVILFVVGFIPHSLNMTATIFVSFACAMQVQTFRKMGGYSYASTMCIGNLRSGTAAFSHYLQDVPGALVQLGTGNKAAGITAPLHSNVFCIEESALQKGSEVFVQYVLENMN